MKKIDSTVFLIIAIFVSLLFVFPINEINFLRGDSLQMIWNIWHSTESILNFEYPFLSHSVTYPIQANLALHTLASGNAIFGVPLKWIFGDQYPIIAFNLSIFFHLLFSYIASFIFLRYYGFSTLEAGPPSLFFTTSNYALLHYVHLNLLPFWIFPILGLGVTALVKNNKIGIIAIAASVGLGLYFSEYSVFAVTAALIYLFVYLILDKKSTIIFLVQQKN